MLNHIPTRKTLLMIIHGNDPFTKPSFSLSNRILRVLWGVVWLLLFRPRPRPFHAWRILLLRLFESRTTFFS